MKPQDDAKPDDGQSASTVVLERMWNAQADEFNQWDALGFYEKLEFAAEVAREKCAQVCEVEGESHRDGFGQHCAAMIRRKK